MNDIAMYIFIAVVAVIFITPLVLKFYKKSKNQKIEALKEWLKYAVTYAEKMLGSGTGQLKLREVYDMALKQFPWLPKLISFELFSKYVDDALVWMRDQLEKNENIKGFVEKVI